MANKHRKREEGFLFTWERPVSRDAFSWVEWSFAPDKPSRLCLKAHDGAGFERYYPLLEPVSLYRELAQTEPTPEGVLAFVTRYGRLGGRIAEPGSTVEPFDRWEDCIIWLCEAVRLWDLVRANNRSELKKVIRWVGPGVVHYVPPPEVISRLDTGPWEDLPIAERQEKWGWDIVGKSFDGETLRGEVSVGDVITPAILLILDFINPDLETGVSPALVWDRRRKRTVLQDFPVSLLGFIHLQFAQAVFNQQGSRQCRVCGRWFELAPASKLRRRRNDRLTCSGSCRTKAYLARQEGARQLHAEGKTLKAIAKELGSTVATIKKWVNNRKG
jgi:hypothetical protein